jgi:adhesin transport system outer membrane protein
VLCRKFECWRGIKIPSTDTETIGSAVQQALVYYPSIQKAQANERGAYYALRQAQGEFLPSLNVNAAKGRERYVGPTNYNLTGNPHINLPTTAKSVQIIQPLFTGFSSYYLVKQRHGELDSANFQILGEKENIALQAAQAFLQVIRANQLVELGKRNVKDHKLTLESIRTQYKGGYARKADEDLADARLALAHSALSSFEGEKQNAITTYLKIIGHQPANLIYPTKPLYCALCDADTIKKEALENNPLVKSAIAKEKAAYYAISTAKSAFYPQVSADLSKSYDNNVGAIIGPVHDQKVGLSMKYNILDGGIDYAKVKQAVEAHKAAKDDTQEAKLSVGNDVIQAWNKLNVAEHQVKQYADYVKYTYATVQGYEGQFKIGTQSLFNVLSMKDELFQARQDYVTAKYNVLLYHYQVLAVSGLLSSSLR